MPVRSLLIWGVVALVLVVAFAALQPPGDNASRVELPYSAFLDRVDAGTVDEATTHDDAIAVRTKEGSEFISYVPQGAMPDTIVRLRSAGVTIRAIPPRRGPTLGDILLGILPMILLIGAWYVFMLRMQAKQAGGSGGST